MENEIRRIHISFLVLVFCMKLLNPALLVNKDFFLSVAKKVVDPLHRLFLSSVGCGQSSWQNVLPLSSQK